MREWMRRWKSLWFFEDQSDSEPFVILEYRAPPGTQTIDNSEEFERVRRCVAEGKDPFEGRYSYTGWGMKRKHLPKTVPILEYRAPPGTQTIDNSEEFERVRRCVAEGKDPFEGRCSHTDKDIRRKHPTRSSKHAYGKPHEWESSKDSDDLETEERF